MQKRSETMKIFMMFVASAASAVLVMPTVTQAETGSLYEQVAEAAAGEQSAEREA
jgi:hypothetical protein